MNYFNGTEMRSLLLATALLMLGAAARLGIGPGPDDFSWTEAAGPGGADAPDLAATRKLVSDGVAEEELAATPLGPNEKLDPNSAGVTELRRLPGVGPTRARAIVKERNSGGAFRDAADLARVTGIGPRTLEALSPHLAFGFRSSAGASAAVARSGDPSAALVDVNRAQIKELEQITGIGPVLAARIITARQRYGRFNRPEDLLRVPGIGPAVLRKISGQMRF